MPFSAAFYVHIPYYLLNISLFMHIYVYFPASLLVLPINHHALFRSIMTQPPRFFTTSHYNIQSRLSFHLICPDLFIFCPETADSVSAFNLSCVCTGMAVVRSQPPACKYYFIVSSTTICSASQ